MISPDVRALTVKLSAAALLLGTTVLSGCGGDSGTVEPVDVSTVQKGMSSGETKDVTKGKTQLRSIKNRPAETPPAK